MKKAKAKAHGVEALRSRPLRIKKFAEDDEVDPLNGELLGEGSFGCVFRPPVKCTSPRTPFQTKTKIKKVAVEAPGATSGAEVGKVFFDLDDFSREMRTSRQVKSVDPNGTNLLVPTASCDTTRQEVLKHPAGLECDKHEEFSGTASDTLKQLIMPYGGDRLDSFVRTQAKPLSPKAFLRLMLPVLEGLQQMEAKGYCHQDIKVSNILANNSKAIIIDYSLMIPLHSVYAAGNRRRWRFSYFPYPPEYKIYNILYKSKSKSKNQQTTTTSSSASIPQVYEEVRKNWFSFGDNKASAYLKLFDENNVWEAVHNFYEWAEAIPASKRAAAFAEFATKLDIYSVGMVFVDISRYLSFRGYPRKSAFTVGYHELVRGMSHPDPRSRLTVGESLDKMKKLIGGR